MILVLAEKPEEAEDIANSILTDKTGKSGYFRGTKDGKEYVVVSAYGHLLQLADPEDMDPTYKTWRLEDLPIFFPNWKKKASSEDYKKKRLALIKQLLSEADTVIAAGDPDEEGQLLIDELLIYFKYKGPVKRVFVNDNMPENIRKEFRNLKDNAMYVPMGKSAHARQIADMCFGVNETRLAALKMNIKGISIGRVQTPTLGLVVARDEQIENHVKSKYYELEAVTDKAIPFKWTPNKKYLEHIDSKYVTDKAYVQGLADTVKEDFFTVTTEKKVKVNNAPLPYNLTVLQSDMNRRYGFSAKQTLDITQSLRSKKAITYNRTDSQYLKEEHFAEAPELFATILGGSLPAKYHMDFKRHSAAFNDANVTAHHGMIPQKNDIDPDKLPDAERKVYMAIVERYAMQFMPPEVKDVSVSTFHVDYEGLDQVFTYTASRVKDPGYTKYFGKAAYAEADKDEDGSGKEYIPAGTWEAYIDHADILEKETKPPARYTQGTLIKDMSSIAKYVTNERVKEILKRKDDGKKGENGSIGTSATRAAIIDVLIKRGFLEEKGKNIISTPYGRSFFKSLPESITKPDTTAWWWLIQEGIKEGKVTDVNTVAMSVINEFNKHKDTAYSAVTVTGSSRKYGTKEKVSGTWHGKEVRINREWGSYRFTDEELDQLFNGDEITIHYPDGKGGTRTYSGKLEEQEYKGALFVGFKGKEVIDTDVYAEGVWNGTAIKLKRTWGTYTFSEDELKKLFADETITIQYPVAGGTKKLTGKLAKQTYKGKRYVGFKTEEAEVPDTHVSGTWKGSKVTLKRTWGEHTFTDRELEALFAGRTISFPYKSKTGKDIIITGKLVKKTYKGNSYVGFDLE